jgi:HK97 family phage portal protein
MLKQMLALMGIERKESRTLSAFVTLGLDMPVWTPRDYERLTTSGYQYNSDVYSCVNLIIRSAKQIPWMVLSKEGGKEVSNNHPLLKLLRKPNEQDTESDFKEKALGYLLLSGNSYIERSGGSEGTPPAFLYAHRPDRIRVIKGNRRQMVNGYEYKAGASPVRFEAWEMLHLRLFNPLDDWYGMSPIEAAAYNIDASNEASALYKKLLQKGYPPGAVTIKGVDYTDEQVRDLKSGLRRASESGDILVLQDGEWKEMGFKPIDGSIFEGKLTQKRDIAACYGVPSGMVGDTQVKTYANSREERRSLYTEAVIPNLTKLRDGLNVWLSPLFDNAFIDFDKDAIDALAEDRDTQAKRVSTLFEADVIKRSEAREELKYEAIEESEDGWFSDLSKPPVAAAANPGVDAQANPAGVDSAGQQPAARRPARANVVAIDARRSDDREPEIKAFNLLSEEQKDQHWKAIETRRDLWYIRVAADVEERFLDEREAVLKAFADTGESGAIRAVSRQEAAWTKLYNDTILAVAEDFGRRTVQSLKHDGYTSMEIKFTLDIFTRTVLDWIGVEGAKRVVGIMDTTKAQIRKELSAGVANGEGIYDLSKRLQGMYTSFSNVRAERIARTEVISASSLGSQTAALATNLPLEKEWIATFDSRTRDPHAHAHGQRVSIAEPYIVGGQKLMFPGDTSLGATGDNTIQCRCTESYRVKRG